MYSYIIVGSDFMTLLPTKIDQVSKEIKLEPCLNLS